MQVFRGIPFHSSGPCALTIGNFDGLHTGHRTMLARLRQEAQRRSLPMAVMTFEPHPRELFTPESAPARLTSLREKLELLRDAGVDRVYVCHFTRKLASLAADTFAADILATQLQARYVLIGDDFRFGKGRSGNVDSLTAASQSLGFEVDAMHSVTVEGMRVSSTAVRDALAAGKIELANTLLGRPYSISGRVVHGQKLGRQLGFPTANIQVKHNRPPLTGIFAVEFHGIGEPRLGAASLGIRPTVISNGQMALEVNVLDFEGDLYGRHVRVDFLHKLRDEAKYPDLETLKAQIGADVEAIRRWFGERISSPRSA
ncbi:bifunctional riboflavin kinase/FAD synthetase [Parachitinimonas caeni]|uniref:Riboflavin biosynthesis protein n=1 Tax=Parachitinimonas caeni TaxID=3031301 RepID=A0ABT7DYD1_9NEIS|nr:bifunctional riboflavin kinase/FAD synthetase [Parachitinimonas caeni]MDK2125074.1 bifunctional riboflavin kinase/FAD synthetase [Parachitinimonas caeni]